LYACFVVFSRDKTELDELICEKWLETLLHYAGLVSLEEPVTSINELPVDYKGNSTLFYIFLYTQILFSLTVKCAFNKWQHGVSLPSQSLAVSLKFMPSVSLHTFCVLCTSIVLTLSNSSSVSTLHCFLGILCNNDPVLNLFTRLWVTYLVRILIWIFKPKLPVTLSCGLQFYITFKQKHLLF
jgi:hypothetical protein